MYAEIHTGIGIMILTAVAVVMAGGRWVRKLARSHGRHR
jgi:hypothetical protein